MTTGRMPRPVVGDLAIHSDVPSLNLPDRDFIATFEQAAFSKHDFPHRAHVRMAWLYIRQLGVDGAVDHASDGIRRLAHAHGHTTLYHDTLTRAWVYLIADKVASPPVEDFDVFLAAHPELLDKQLLFQHYSSELLYSADARAHWVAPDLRPIPGAPNASQ
jgi:hypothetical protein